MTVPINRVKWCPVCNQGWVQFVRDRSKQQIYLCCDECESEWVDPGEIRRDNGTQGLFEGSEDVDIEDLEQVGWHAYLLSD